MKYVTNIDMNNKKTNPIKGIYRLLKALIKYNLINAKSKDWPLILIIKSN